MTSKKLVIAAALLHSISAAKSTLRVKNKDDFELISRELQEIVKINPLNDHGTWEGWGLSLAWLANLFGEDEKLADMFFTMEESVKLAEGLDSLPALGLNIARYNAGGTCGGQRDDLDIFQGVSTVACQYDGVKSKWSGTTYYRRIQTFWMNWGSKDRFTNM